jgi:hypothetical protein
MRWLIHSLREKWVLLLVELTCPGAAFARAKAATSKSTVKKVDFFIMLVFSGCSINAAERPTTRL